MNASLRIAATGLVLCLLVGVMVAWGQPAVRVVQPATPGYWTYSDGYWMYRNNADNRWYYNDGRHWYYNDADRWNVYRFDGGFGRDFRRDTYTIPGTDARIEVPRFRVPAIRDR
jgi:hypothetical protein